MRLWNEAALAALLAASSCSSAPARAPRALTMFSGLIASNSPMLLEVREPQARGGGLEVTYSVIVENGGEARVDVELRGATVRMGDRWANATCVVHGNAIEVLAVSPTDRWRVDCHLRLSPEDVGVLRRSDADLVLTIPVRAGQNAGALSFIYWLRLEDAT